MKNEKALELSTFFLEYGMKMIVQGRPNIAQFAHKKQEQYWKVYARGGKIRGAS